MNKNDGFSLIEVLLAIAILTGTILCLLDVFTPVLVKLKKNQINQKARNIEEKINVLIQSNSFNEIFLIVQTNQPFYFYENHEGIQKQTTDLNTVGTGHIIKVTLSCVDGNVYKLRPEDYPRSYFPIWVRLDALPNKNVMRGKQSKISSFTTIKNR